MAIYKIFSLFVYGALFITLISCSNDNENFEGMLKQCPIQYKLKDFEIIQNYYSKIINSHTQFIAFKEFSTTGYRLVSLIYSKNQSILSVSIPAYKNATFYKKTPPNQSKKIFDNLSYISKLDNFKGNDSFHPACFFITIKTDHINTVSTLYNPSVTTLKQTNNNSLEIYTLLQALVKNNFPDLNQKIEALIATGAENIPIKNRTFKQDDYVNAT